MTVRVDLPDDVARINEFAEELNREAEDVLEYQVMRRDDAVSDSQRDN